jgi:inosose dehydratase
MTAARVELAGGPVSWGVDFTGAPGNPPYDDVLAGIAAAGLRWTELGPLGYVPADRRVLARHGLRCAGTFVFEPLSVRGGGALAAAHAALDAIVASGGRLLVVIDRPCSERAVTAGRPAAAERLDAAGRRVLVDTVRAIAAAAGERGIRAVLHPHAGGFLEFEDEVDALLAAVPGAELGLCVDTGHALFAGSDPAALIARYAERVEHMHLKDVDPAQLAAVRGSRRDFWAAVESGVFCPVGSGMLDVAAVRSALDAAQYVGLATVEQDRRPGTPGDPAVDLRRSVERLRAAGLG